MSTGGSREGAVVMRAQGIVKHFRRSDRGGRPVRAVDHVDIELHRGKLYGLLGESGSGKSTLAEVLAGLQWPSAGRITVAGEELAQGMRRARWRALRRSIQVVFQNPFESVNPRFRVDEIVAEPLEVAGLGGKARRAKVAWALDQVSLPSASDFAKRFPHELSGGQLQRVCIARALTVEPDILIADEPVSMLDLSVRAGVLRLLDELKRSHDMAILMISHDISTLAAVADTVGVMYAGQIVESGPTEDLMRAPRHPYLRALLSAVPTLGDELLGEADSMTLGTSQVDLPLAGCLLAPRCPLAEARCKAEEQTLRPVSATTPNASGSGANPPHEARCWKALEDA